MSTHVQFSISENMRLLDSLYIPGNSHRLVTLEVPGFHSGTNNQTSHHNEQHSSRHL